MIELETLSAETFRPFGQVAQPGLGQVKEIRDGTVRLTRSPALLDRDDEAVDLALDFYEAMRGKRDALTSCRPKIIRIRPSFSCRSIWCPISSSCGPATPMRPSLEPLSVKAPRP